MIDWRPSARGGAASLSAHRAIAVARHFESAVCTGWIAGTYAAKDAWTSDFDGAQFTLGRAFYTHLEQGRSNTYFKDAAASDARVEKSLPGLQGAMRALVADLTLGSVRQRHGWCGAGVHIFPAGGEVAEDGGVVHYDTEGLTEHHIARRARAITVVAMFQPPRDGGGLCVWDVTYDGRDAATDEELASPSEIALYRAGDVVVIDSYRMHQIQPFEGDRDRISATLHAAEVDDGQWETWF